jgi:hypothetical protein
MTGVSLINSLQVTLNVWRIAQMLSQVTAFAANMGHLHPRHYHIKNLLEW